MPVVLLIGGLLAALAYYAIAVQRGADGHPAIPQSDALVFMQYARSMAEGHPYAYSVGDTPSTGSTSHLYPACLALLVKLGAHADALITAAFAFNALCYLLWLQLFWLVAKRIFPTQAILAAALALLNGHLLMSALSLTDMALFTVISWSLFAALLYERPRLATLCLVVCVFTRPEGMLLAIGLAAMGAFLLYRRDPGARLILTIGVCGLAAVTAVFLLNQALTGFVQFQSVAQKGYLKIFPFLGALGNTGRDFGTLVREILFNAGIAPRQLYYLPVAGGLLAVAGLCRVAHTARAAVLVIWWLGCSLAALGLIAASEWQGISTDRYLLWILPTWYLLAAGGAGLATAACRTRQLYPILAILLTGYEVAAWPYFSARYAAECMRAQAVVNFAKRVEAQLPPQAAVGVVSGAAMAYELSQHPVRHLPGITTPAFARQRDALCAMEMLKHCPEYRFTFLVLTAAEQGWCANAGLLGELLLTDLDAPQDGDVYALYTARWETFSAAALQPLTLAISRAVASLTLVDQLDVGFAPDERRCHYLVGSRLPDQICRPCVAVRRLGDQSITEVGQVVLGWDEFHMHAAQLNRPMRVVLRTMPDATCTIIRTTDKFPGESIHLSSPIQLRPIVNGQALPVVSLPISTNTDTFTECIIDLPSECVTTDPLEIVFAGDHIALAYWCYQ